MHEHGVPLEQVRHVSGLMRGLAHRAVEDNGNAVPIGGNDVHLGELARHLNGHIEPPVALLEALRAAPSHVLRCPIMLRTPALPDCFVSFEQQNICGTSASVRPAGWNMEA